MPKAITLSPARAEDLRLLLDYCFEDEESSFDELDKPEHHIFRAIRRLQAVVDDRKQRRPAPRPPAEAPTHQEVRVRAEFALTMRTNQSRVNLEAYLVRIQRAFPPQITNVLKAEYKEEAAVYGNAKDNRWRNLLD